MKTFLIAVCMILVGTVVVGTWLAILNSEEAFDGSLSVPFEDVPEDAWYHQYVAEAYDRGWVKGHSLTMFQPDMPLLRGEFAMILYRYLGEPDVTDFENPFTDLENLDCKNSVIYLKKLGILDGKTETTFAPYEEITREQLITMLYRMGGYQVDKELSPSGTFTDRGEISPWAVDAVDWAVHNGLLSGLTSTTLAPKSIATRAQGTKILCLYAEKAGYQTATSDAGRTVTLRVWQAGVDDSNAALTMNKLLNRFEKRNPNITVEYTPLPSKDDPYAKIQTALATGEGPDVVLVSAPYEMQLADEGLILPLDTLLTEKVLADVHPLLLMDCSYGRDTNPDLQGKLVSAPLFSTPRALLVSRSLFDHSGLSYPNNDYTYERLLSDAQALTGSKDGKVIYGLGTGITSPGLYLGLVRSYGGRIVDPTTGLASTNNTQWKKATEAYLSLYSQGLTPDRTVSMDYSSRLGMFAGGTVAMIDASLNAASLIQKQSGWGDDLALYPFLDNAQSACLCVGEVAVISHSTENMVDSAKLINFLMEPDSQLAYSKGVGYLPGVLTALKESDVATDSYLSPYKSELEETLTLGSHGYEIHCLIRDELQKVLRGELTVEEYCVGLEQKINAILQP